MCGIAGIFSAGNNTIIPDLCERLRAMSRAQVHRGPDDEGIYLMSDGRGGLANRRLAIRDLSPAGHMPMSNAEETVWITYNGEIYNTDELRPALAQAGCSFRSHSDAEVILQGYLVWGESVVERLCGIFAFAILDTRQGESCSGRLFLARDRLGVKPLYYAQTSDAFVFASELKALQASGLVGREVSPAALVGYLMLGSVPIPLTIYRDVLALDAGCSLTLQLDRPDARKEPVRYWSLPVKTEEPASDADAVEQVQALLEDAVRSELVSDVPLGAFLSGGLDSSAIVALMRKATDGPIRTCSMIFEEEEYSEAPYARAMAEAVGAEHYERVITAQDLARELDRIFWAMEQPTVDGVNTYFVAQTAREAGLTVALSGLGADELFGGYANTFQGMPRLMRALKLAHAVPAGTALAHRAIDILPQRQRWAKLQDALRRDVSPMSAYLAWRGLFSPSEVRELVTSEMWSEAMETFDPIRYIGSHADGKGDVGTFDTQPFAWSSRAELGTYMHSQLLRDTDVMSMAHSLEVRVPFLDHRLVEAVLRLPARFHRGAGSPKPLLRSTIAHALPLMIGRRSGKQGFTFPFAAWMRGPLRSTIEPILEDTAAASWLSGKAVRTIWHDFEAGRIHWSRPWSMVCLQGWGLHGDG